MQLFIIKRKCEDPVPVRFQASGWVNGGRFIAFTTKTATYSFHMSVEEWDEMVALMFRQDTNRDGQNE